MFNKVHVNNRINIYVDERKGNDWQQLFFGRKKVKSSAQVLFGRGFTFSCIKYIYLKYSFKVKDKYQENFYLY